MTRRRTTAALLLSLALFTGACAGDDPTLDDAANEAREVAEDAERQAEELAQTGEDAVEDAVDGSADVTLAIESPDDGASVPAGELELVVDVEGVEIVAADGDTTGRTGHFHVFIDRDPVPEGEVIPREEGIIHSTDNPIPVPDLSPGDHQITVVLGDGNHNRIHGDVSASVNVTVT